MEYLELHAQEQQRLENLIDMHRKLSALIKESRRILGKHLTTVQRKQDLYDKHVELKESDSETADVLWDEKKLGVSENRKDKKASILEEQEKHLRELETKISQTRGLIKAIAQYNPCARFVKENKEEIEENFVFIGKSKRLKGKKDNRKNVRKLRNSRSTTWQMMFTPRNYHMAPKSGRNYDGVSFDDIPLSSFPVAPHLIQESLLDALGIEFHPASGHELDIMREKEKKIPLLANIFENHASPMVRYSDGKRKESNYRMWVINGFNSKSDGIIINPRYRTDAPEDERQKESSHFKDIYSAFRKTGHVNETYESERPMFIWLQARFEYIQNRLSKISPQKENGEEEKKELRDYLDEIIKVLNEFLKKPVNHNKKTIKLTLNAIVDLRDKTGKENIGASRARLVKGLNYMCGRSAEVYETSSASLDDAKTLINNINTSEVMLVQCSEAIQRYLESGDISELKYLQGRLGELNIRPYNRLADFLIKAIDKNGKWTNPELKRREIIRALVATKFFNVYREVQSVIMRVNEMRGIYKKESFTDLVDHLKDVVAESGISEYPNALKGINELLEEARQDLERKCEGGGLVIGLAAILKKHLKGFDLEALLGQIR